MKLDKTDVRRRLGRPLSFDREAALNQAMLLFWQHGYESTSISDLTGAMGITPPSLYAAFGDKKRLFLEAVKLYQSGPVSAEQFIAEAATAREAAEGMLASAALRFSGDDTPPGCLVTNAAISCSAKATDVQEELAAIRRDAGKLLRRKIEAASISGELPAGTDADALAGHVMVVIHGMATLARDGASREKLMRVAHCAMLAWPNKRVDPSVLQKS